MSKDHFNRLVAEYKETLESLTPKEKAIRENQLAKVAPPDVRVRTKGDNEFDWLSKILPYSEGDKYTFTIRHQLLNKGPVADPLWKAWEDGRIKFSVWVRDIRTLVNRKIDAGVEESAELYDGVTSEYIASKGPRKSPGTRAKKTRVPASKGIALTTPVVVTPLTLDSRWRRLFELEYSNLPLKVQTAVEPIFMQDLPEVENAARLLGVDPVLFTLPEIKKRHLKCAIDAHPDKHMGDPSAHEKAAQINVALKTLEDFRTKHPVMPVY